MRLFRIIALLLILAAPLFAQQVSDEALSNYATPAGLAELIESEQESYLLVDVRTAGEYNRGHIPSAINVPYQVISRDLPETEGDTIVVVYCQSGRRSGIAYENLRSQGYDRVVDFGGIVRWQGELER